MTYDKGRISARLGLTHNDAYIYVYNYTDGTDGGLKGPNGDQYTYAHTQLDAQGSVRLKGGLKAVVSLLNLNHEVLGFFQGSPQYPVQREFYGPTFMGGIAGRVPGNIDLHRNEDQRRHGARGGGVLASPFAKQSCPGPSPKLVVTRFLFG